MYLDGELQESYRRSGAGASAGLQKDRTEFLRRALSRPGSLFVSNALKAAVSQAQEERKDFAKALQGSR